MSGLKKLALQEIQEADGSAAELEKKIAEKQSDKK